MILVCTKLCTKFQSTSQPATKCNCGPGIGPARSRHTHYGRLPERGGPNQVVPAEGMDGRSQSCSRCSMPTVPTQPETLTVGRRTRPLDHIEDRGDPREARPSSRGAHGLRPATPGTKYLGQINVSDRREDKILTSAWRTPPWLVSGWGCRDRRLSRGCGSPRQADAAQQVGEARVTSEWVHPGIHPGPRQSIRAFVISLVEPLECSIRLSQANEDACDIKRTNITLF